MPGKLCVGQATNNSGAALLSSSKAYCAGMLFRTQGTAAEKPSTDNPHGTTSDDAIAWDLGWKKADAAAGGSMTRADMGCCSVPPAVAA